MPAHSSDRTRVRTLAPVWFIVALATGCTTLSTPEHFVRLEGGAGVRFVTADDAKVWVRSFPVEESGDLDFWCEAFLNEAVEKRRYELVEKNEVEDGGIEGRELIFSTLVEGRPYRYLVTLYLRARWPRNRVQVVEFLAEEEPFEEHLPNVRLARASLR